jgi:group I intron endonuclease
MIGIYRIRCISNGKQYIGSTSVSFETRWAKHRAFLTRGNHPCRHLQNAWNKYGSEQFVFEVVEEVEDPDQVTGREQVWIDAHWNSGTLYNASPTAGSTRGFRFSDESRSKIATA